MSVQDRRASFHKMNAMTQVQPGEFVRAACLYTALTFVLAYPLSFSPATLLLADDPDAHLYLWTMGWNAHAMVAQPLGIFDANIYHPERLSLAFSENLIGTALFAAPVWWATGNLVLSLNVALLATPVLCGLGVYVLARRLGLGVAAAVVGGLVFAFSPARFFRLPQPHVTAVQWLPFMLAFLHMYLDRGRPRDLRAALGFFSLQAVTTGHGAAFAILAASALLGWRLAHGEPLALVRRLRDVGLAGAMLLLPSVLIYLPYRLVQDDLGLRRTLAGWAPTPESFLASPSTVHTWLAGLLPGPHLHETATAFLFPGFVPVALAAIALWWSRSSATPWMPVPGARAWRRLALAVEVLVVAALGVALYVALVAPIRWRVDGVLLFTARDPWRAALILLGLLATRAGLSRVAPFAPYLRVRARWESWRAGAAARRTRPAPFYALLTLLGVGLSMGPPIGLWPLVYWLPGLSFIRVPSRFMVVAVLGLAVLSAIGIERLREAVPARRWRLVVAMVAALFLVEASGVPISTVAYRFEPPAVDRWLAEQPRPFVVAEVPVYLAARSQTIFMLHSTAHWEKTVHGYSGGQPRLHDELYDVMRGFPDDASLARLSDIGVDYIVIHPEMYYMGEWEAVRQRLPLYADHLDLVFEADGDRVYRLRR
jgi:hypothetical protein